MFIPPTPVVECASLNPCRQLMHSSNFSSSNGSTEDLFRDSIDSCDNDITEKVGDNDITEKMGSGWVEEGFNVCTMDIL